MIEEIISSGFCPKQNKEYSVLVRYDSNVRILCECKSVLPLLSNCQCVPLACF